MKKSWPLVFRNDSHSNLLQRQRLILLKLCVGTPIALGGADLSDTNPYLALETVDGSTTGQRARRSSLLYARAVFYFHVLVVCWFAVFTLSDTGQIKVPDFVKMLFYFRPVQMPLVFTWMLCPTLMAVAAAKLTNRSTAFRAGLVVGDASLSVFQIGVMLPLVQ